MFLDTGMLDVRAGWDDVMTLHIDPVHSISEDQTPAQTYYGQELGQQLGPEREKSKKHQGRHQPLPGACPELNRVFM